MVVSAAARAIRAYKANCSSRSGPSSYFISIKVPQTGGAQNSKYFRRNLLTYLKQKHESIQRHHYLQMQNQQQLCQRKEGQSICISRTSEQQTKYFVFIIINIVNSKFKWKKVANPSNVTRQ
jgi:hypothetical protein